MKKNRNSLQINRGRMASLAEKTEKILLTMPGIIASQIGKDLIVLRKKEIKLKGDLKKAHLQKIKLMVRSVALKKKKSPAANKQLKTVQKASQKVIQGIDMLVRDIDITHKQFLVLSQKKDKYNAIQSELTKFEKDWNKKQNRKSNTNVKKKGKIKSDMKLLEKSKPIAERKINNSSVSPLVEVIEIPLQENVNSKLF